MRTYILGGGAPDSPRSRERRHGEHATSHDAFGTANHNRIIFSQGAAPPKMRKGPHPREADCFHRASLLERPRCSVRRFPRACSELRRGGGRGSDPMNFKLETP
jgi:hypothetical protein